MTEALPAVVLRGLRHRWPGARDDTLRIDGLLLRRGASLFVRGPSGCGKSTLLSLLAGVHAAAAGRVEVLGQDLAALSAAQRDALRGDRLGIVFQQFNLLPYLSALDNVLLPCRLSRRRALAAGGSAAEQQAAACRLLDGMALPRGLWRQPASRLSIGQQQRVAAARALIGRPELVLADEPTSALDADLRDRFVALLTAQCADAGAALVFVSHDRALAPHFAQVMDLAPGAAPQRLAA